MNALHEGRHLAVQPGLCIGLSREVLAVLLPEVIDVACAPALALAVELGRNAPHFAVGLAFVVGPEVFDSGAAVPSCGHGQAAPPVAVACSCSAIHARMVLSRQTRRRSSLKLPGPEPMCAQ